MKYISTILSVLALFLCFCLLTGLFWFGLPFAGKPALSDSPWIENTPPCENMTARIRGKEVEFPKHTPCVR